MKQDGLYWRPLGGNNIDQISGHCYQYTDVVTTNGKTSQTIIMVDLGKFDNHYALGIKNSKAAVPDIRELLSAKELMPRALFITHSHPDHLNGIIHYLKAGYKLPTLYGGHYTQMILEELYDEFQLPNTRRPPFKIIKDGGKIKIGSLQIEILAASHTCFDSLSLIIKSRHATVYHTGDMKIDSSTYFRKPTNLKRLKELRGQIDHVVADFCAINEDGYAIKEVATFKKLVELIKKSRKDKIFIPVYPTHPEMYIMAFLAALKLKKNVVFYGNRDFYTYLELVVKYGISFTRMAQGRIKVLYKPNDELAELGNNYAVIGTFNDLGSYFNASSKDCFGIITARTYFNPLKGQLNAHNIKFVTVQEAPELQGYGHGFLKDFEYINELLAHPTFIPTHCPLFVIDSFRPLAEYIGMKLIADTPVNNQVFRLDKSGIVKVQSAPAVWLVVNYDDDYAYFTEVWQRPTSGEGYLKRTISARKCKSKFHIALHLRKKGRENGTAKIQ